MLRGYNFVVYNGITLEVVKLVSHKREAVFDKAKINYMFTRHTLVVRAVLGPTAGEHKLVDMAGTRVRPNTLTLEDTPYSKPTPVSAIPGDLVSATIPADPLVGLEIDNAIKHKLLAPRKKLIYVVGGNYVIDSPHGLEACDVSFGPIPLFCHVEKISGMGSVSVLFGIQTDINQCPLFDGEVQCGMSDYVLSHEYSQQVEINELFKTVRTTRGEIRVRADKMASAPCTPDAFREYFAQACPAHYKREKIRVVQHPDMTRLEYSIVDVEQERPIVNAFESEVHYDIVDPETGEVTHRRVFIHPAISRVAKMNVRHKVTANREFKGYNAYFGIPDPGLLAPGGDPNNEMRQRGREAIAEDLWHNIARRWAEHFENNLEVDRLRFSCPNVTETLTIELFGNPASTRYELELVAWYILIVRMGTFKAQADNAPGPFDPNKEMFRDLFYAGGNIQFDIEHDVMANYVKMVYSYQRAAPAAQSIAGLIGKDGALTFGPALSGEQSIVGDEIIPNITLHSFRSDHTDDPDYATPAHTLDDNVYNPWGRPGDYMHGTDSMPVRVIHAHDQCKGGTGSDESGDGVVGHANDLPLREDNLDASGCVSDRQPEIINAETKPMDAGNLPESTESYYPEADGQCEPAPGWYCVGGVTGYYNSAPEGATAGPFPTEAQCYMNCEGAPS